MPYWVYNLANRRNGTLYVGATNDPSRRTSKHREGIGATFTRKYGVKKLVYATTFVRIVDAIAHEKRLKRWHRAWKLKLIEDVNPDWDDLYDRLNA